MKKILSILLFVLLIFNMTGFSIYSLLQANQIESESASGEDMVLKVPFSLPYVTDWQSNENFERELLHGNSIYDVVSQKIANDTLYIECQFDESARDRFWQLVSNFDDHLKASHDSKSQAGSLMKSLLKEYMSTDKRHYFYLIEWITPKEHFPARILSPLAEINKISTPPPNLV